MKWLLLASLCLGVAASSSATAGVILPPLNTTQCHSLNNNTEATIRFSNNTLAAVDVYWLDYSGVEVFYYTLAPGQVVLQPTWLTHPWIVRLNSNNLRLEGFLPQTASPHATPDPDTANIHSDTGPFPNACPPTPTEPVTWSRIKSVYGR